MEPTNEKLRTCLSGLEEGFATLKEAVAEAPSTRFVGEAVIKRFEYVFELSWKAIQAAGVIEGLHCATPREAIKIAYKKNWIDDAQPWFKMLATRNTTAHVYNELMAEGVCDEIRSYPPVIDELLTNLKKFLTEL